MVNDSVVGVIGALVIVGSMAAAIQTLDTGDGPTGTDSGPPAAPDQTRWQATGCQALTLTWDVPAADLEEHVAPWTPAQGGEFRLTAWSCDANAVNASDVGSASGAFAIVPVEAPEDAKNVTADAWRAAPEVVGPAGDAVPDAYAANGFPVTDGSASVTVDATPLTRQASITIDTPDGELTADAVIQDSPSDAEARLATLAPGNETFSVAYGTETATERPATQAIVQTSGDTWVQELGLSDTPDEATLAEDLERRLSMWEVAWDQTVPANATAGAGT